MRAARGPEKNDELAGGGSVSSDSKAETKRQPHLSLINGLATEPRWVAWREETDKGKPTKVPYSPSGVKARSNDPSTWGTREQAEHRWRKLQNGDGSTKGGVGIVLGDLDADYMLMGIDLDDCITLKGNVLNWADEIIDRFNTYAEVSPSSRGVKLFFLVSAKDKDAVHKLLSGNTRKAFVAGEHREVAIDRARYYAVTDDQLDDDTPKMFRVVDVDDIRWFIEEAGPRYKRRYKKDAEGTKAGTGYDETGSGYGFRFMLDYKKRGLTYKQARAAILKDKGPAGEWARREGDSAIKRAWNKIDIEEQPTKVCDLVCAADVVMRPIDWLWKGHIARGNLEMTTGLPGLGKSQFQLSLAASLTTGGKWPDGTQVDEACNVLLVTAEDCLDQVVVPRLVAAGADLNRIHALKLIRVDDKRRMFLLAEDLDTLEDKIAETQAAWVAIDPITAFLGRINNNMPTDVRNQLGPLADLAERTNTAFSTITHPPKTGGNRAHDHFIGSQAYIAAARIGHVIVPEMSDDDEPEPTGYCLVANAKNNIHPLMPTLVYCIEQTVVGKHAAQIVAPFLHWCGQTEMTADEAIAATKPQSKTKKADQFLKSFLANGEKWQDEVMEAAKAQGFTENQIRDARIRLKITQDNGCVWKEGFKGWKWKLPE